MSKKNLWWFNVFFSLILGLIFISFWKMIGTEPEYNFLLYVSVFFFVSSAYSLLMALGKEKIGLKFISYFIIGVIVIVIFNLVFSSSQPSRWSQLSTEEKNEIEQNMELFDWLLDD